MPTMKLPDAVAGKGAKCMLVLFDRVMHCELDEARINAVIGTVNGEADFIDDSLIVRFKIVKQEKIDPAKAGAVQQAIDRVLHDRGARQVDLE